MISYLTVDAGIVFKAIAPHRQQQAYIDLVTQWQQAGYQLCAPTLSAYELTSTFTKMAHFGQMSWDSSREGVLLALKLGVQLVSPDEDLIKKAFTWTERLQRAAAYGSFYLALAETLSCELWTVDIRLVNAAKQPWVRLADEKIL